MTLYHFTLERYVDSIREHGLLSIAEKRRLGMYPDGWMPPPEVWEGEDELVWLTSDPDSNAGVQFHDPVYRVTVEVEGATKWFSYMAAHHIPGVVRKSMRTAALLLSPTNRDVNWYVATEAIPPECITSIDLFDNTTEGITA